MGSNVTVENSDLDPVPVRAGYNVKTETFASAGDSLAINTVGMATVLVRVDGSYVGGGWVHEVSLDGVEWDQLLVSRLADLTTQFNMGTVDNYTGVYRVNVAGTVMYRLRCTNLTSGTVAVTAVASAVPAGALTSAGLVATNDPGNFPGIITAGGVAGYAVLGGTLAGGGYFNLTAVGHEAIVDATGYASFQVTIMGLYAGFSGVFEVDLGGGVWIDNILGARLGTAILETGPSSLTNTTRTWIVNIPYGDTFRLRCTAIASGTATVHVASIGAPTAHGSVVQVANAVSALIADGGDAALGATTDPDTANTAIGRLKKIVSLLAGGLPSILISDRLPVTTRDWSGKGNINANGGKVQVLTVYGASTIQVQITGTWSGTLRLQGTLDSTTWEDIPVTLMNAPGTPANTITANGFYAAVGGAYALLQVIATAWTSGTAAVDILTGGGAGYVRLLGASMAAGDVAHDGTDSGNPLKVGAKALAHGANPTAVAAGDRTDLYANRHGIPFVVGGHPNVIPHRVNYTAAQTDTAIITVSSGTKIVVTRILATADNANTVDVAVRIGFGAATTPTGAGVLAAHPGIPAGAGFATGDGSGILGVGADGEDLRITSEVPTSGSIDVTISYYPIES